MKKEYMKPTVKVVLLQHRTHLLGTSDSKKWEKPNDYKNGGDPLGF